jgi:molecular chaperone GrpE (heat shock protein)
LKGVELIHEKLRSTLISKGLEQVEVKAGDAFDADFAEAITQIPRAKMKIVDVLEKGYKLGDIIPKKSGYSSNADRCDAMNWVCAFIRKKLR